MSENPHAVDEERRKTLERAWEQRCHRCKKINRQFILQERDLEPWYSNFYELEESAVSGCDLCRHFLQEVIHHHRHEESYDDEAPISLISTHNRWLAIDAGDQAYMDKPLLDLESPEKYQSGAEPRPSILLEQRSDSPNIFELARSWLDRCAHTHDASSPPSGDVGNFFPSRVLDLGDETPVSHVRLIDSMSICDRVGTSSTSLPWYCTLSYCWGKNGHVAVTTRANLQQRQAKIDANSLPKTFQDAIQIAQELGVKYLWIDALCIIQPSDEDKSDWETESALMGDVYRNSYCTIAATGASECEQGCFISRHSSTFLVQPCLIDLDPPLYLNPRGLCFNHNVRGGPLNRRGWVLQEQILSFRTLHFTKDGLFWSCCDQFASECEPAGFKPDDTSDNIIFSAGFLRRTLNPKYYTDELWYTWVQDYSGRALTNSADRLPALSGIAKQLEIATGDESLAGLWRSRLISGLSWFVRLLPYSIEQLYGDRGRGYNSPVCHLNPTLFHLKPPSWSWAAAEVQVIFVMPFRGSPRGGWIIEAEVLDVAVQPAGLDRTGQLNGGKLHISGFISRLATWKLSTTVRSRYKTYDLGKHSACSVISDRDDNIPDEDLICLLLGKRTEEKEYVHPDTHHGLLLAVVDIEERKYRRVGYVEVSAGGNDNADVQQLFYQKGRSHLTII